MKKTLMIAAMVAACMMAALPASAEPSATHPTVQAYATTEAQPGVATAAVASFEARVTEATLIALAESPQAHGAVQLLDTSMTATSTNAGPEVLVAKKGGKKGGGKKVA